MSPDEAELAAIEWNGEAGGVLLPQITANELAGIVNEAMTASETRLDVLERESAESFERWHKERRKRERLVVYVDRCYRMLLSEPDTKGALFKAENILREALADQK